MPAVRLTFDFAAPPNRRLVFERPIETLVATRAHDVPRLLDRVDHACRHHNRWAAGFVAYEAAPAFEPAFRTRPPGRLPLAWFGIFDAPRETEPSAVCPDAGPPDIDWRPDIDRAAYDTALAAIRDRIARGETYQVNYSFRMRGQFDGEAGALYDAMTAAQGTGRHALLELGRFSIVSASPELFFERDGCRITARPMKGTAPRGRFVEEDDAAAEALAASGKDRAENLMIVDLLRNDIGRVARIGSVSVPAMHTVERYRTVLQMTSTVTAMVDPVLPLVRVFGALFPCGSVTGAPKIQTMRIIAALERAAREAYCGAIGYVRPGGDCSFNVAIRTAWIDHEAGTIEYGVGGGITWDSTADGEYEEAIAKAAVLAERWPRFELIETMRAEGGACMREALHLARMRESARYFGYPFEEEAAARMLQRAASEAAGPVRLRLLLAPDGALRLERAPLAEPFGSGPDAGGDARPIVIDAEPVRSTDRFLFHKTTHRYQLDRRRAARPDCHDVLLRNERDRITEFTTGNLVVQLEGRFITPPLGDGLLAGTLRAELLEAGVLEERAITSADISEATPIWLINSVRGWVRVRRVS